MPVLVVLVQVLELVPEEVLVLEVVLVLVPVLVLEVVLVPKIKIFTMNMPLFIQICSGGQVRPFTGLSKSRLWGPFNFK